MAGIFDRRTSAPNQDGRRSEINPDVTIPQCIRYRRSLIVAPVTFADGGPAAGRPAERAAQDPAH